MSVSGHPKSRLLKEPPRFYEGDPYRARPEAGRASARGILGPPAERRFQINGNMAPQMAYGNSSYQWSTEKWEDDREWMAAGHHSYNSDNSSHSDYHNTGYQSSGPPSSNQGHPSNHVKKICPPSGHPENSYQSDGYHNKSFIHHNSYTPPRPPEFSYPSSGHPMNQHLPPGRPSNGSTGPPISRPHENGFTDDLSYHHGVPPPVHHHSTNNGPAHPPSRDLWWHPKPHPHHDHAQGPPPPMHDGQSNFRPAHPDTNYRPPSSNYRAGPDGSNFRADDGCHGHWRSTGPPRDKMATPPSRPQASWDTSDPRYHGQRRMPDPNPRKNFIVTSEERRHSYMPLDRGPYSPSLSSQSSWSPETGSPRLRLPLPSPSTPEDWQAMSDLHTPDLHPHHHHPQHSAESQSGHHVFTSSAQSPLEKERCRVPRAPDSGRTLSPGGRMGRDDRHGLRPRFHERRTPSIINGFEGDGPQSVRDPRQAKSHRTKLEHRRVLREHSYSRRYQEKYDKHPRFRRIEPCSNFNPLLLTPLRSSSAASKTQSTNQTTAADEPPDPERGEGDSTTSTSSEKESSHFEKLQCPSAVSSERPRSSESDAESECGTESPAPSTASTAQQRSLPNSESSSAMTAEPKHGSEVTSLPGDVVSEKSGVVQPKHKSVDEEVAPQTKPKQSKTPSDEKKASTSPLTGEALCSLEGFHLDLDLEATTSGSNSTCCSESEEMAGGGNDSDAEDKEKGTAVDGAESSSDESASLMLENGGNLEKKSPEKWSVCLPEPGKIRFSRLDNIEDSPESERLSVKQMTSNRIQLRNGRVLPSSSLAFFTTSQKVLSPPQQPSAKGSPAGSPTRLRRSKRLAMAGEEGTPQWKETGSTASSDVAADQSFEMQLSEEHSGSSDESEFELPAFDPVPLKSSLPESKTLSVRGKRGRGRGRRGRRWGKRGGIQNSEKSDAQSGVQFYVHEPRTREEDGILQRRLALELEVKRNEKIQSEHILSSATHHDDTTRDDDRESMVSGSLPASTSSLDSLQHLQSSSKASTNSNSTEFSAELIARVKKISTARSSGDTPLHKCCRQGKYDMVRYLLLVENCGVNVQDNAGWTPLHEATSNGHTEVAELLLQHGADSNTSAKDGTRPIHDAIEIGCLELVKLLIDYKADVMMEFGERTAVEFAMEHKQLEIAEYIKDVIQMRQESRKATLAAAAAAAAMKGRNSTHQKSTSTRMSKKDKLLKQAEDNTPRIPVSGYEPGFVTFGEELDFPLFYVSPIVELSSQPHFSVYNFQISPLGTPNPRRHNFYLLDDLLEALDAEEDELVEECQVNILELSVAEFVHRMKDRQYNLQSSVPDRIRALPHKQLIKFFPLCQRLSEMLDIVTENLDN